ncbi:MAG: hypothetical protein KKH01_00450 [Firmicutes bacterium]|nr:hypothetical protein [Bacillota bacterium]
MRKLLEKPLFHYTLVLAMVSLVCGFAIGGVNAITQPIIENNVIEATNAAYISVLPGYASSNELSIIGDPASIQNKLEGKDASGQTIGYIYKAYGTNRFGSMLIVVGIDNSGIITGAEFITINQTYQVNGTRTNLSLYIGSSITDLIPNGDIITGATFSLVLAQSLLADIATAYGNTQINLNHSLDIDSSILQSEVAVR